MCTFFYFFYFIYFIFLMNLFDYITHVILMFARQSFWFLRSGFCLTSWINPMTRGVLQEDIFERCFSVWIVRCAEIVRNASLRWIAVLMNNLSVSLPRTWQGYRIYTFCHVYYNAIKLVYIRSQTRHISNACGFLQDLKFQN